MRSNIVLPFSILDYKFSLSSALISPLAVNSGVGSVKGGISPFEDIPDYFYQRREIRGEIIKINKFRHGDNSVVPKGEITQVEDLSFYIGPLHQHFGHFILESITRCWLLSVLEKIGVDKNKIKFVCLLECSTPEERACYSVESIPRWQLDILDFIGLNTSNIYLLKEPTFFKNIIISDQGFLYGGKQKPSYYKFLNDFNSGYLFASQKKRHKKIFLRRPIKYLKNGYVAGESYLAKFFLLNGYFLFDSDCMGFDEQNALALDATHAFGVQSSSFHIFNLSGGGVVKCGVLQRVARDAHLSFINSLNFFVSEVDALQYSQAMQANSGAGTHQLAIFSDVKTLLNFFVNFDHQIDISVFDCVEYEKSVDNDVSNFIQECKH